MDFETLDRGVRSRVDLDMPHDQIDAWITSQGWDPAAYRTVALEGGELKNAARTFGQGVTMGFGDEAEAGIRSMLPGGPPYAEGVKDARRGIAAYSTMNPKTATALELGGAAVPALLGGAAIQAPRTVLGAAMQGAGLGAVGGGIAGAGYAGDTAEERLSGAGMGAMSGGLLGGALGGALGGIGRAGQLSAAKPERLAAQSLSDDGVMLGSGGRAAATALIGRAAGKPMMAAELAGPSSMKRLDAAIVKAGPEAAEIERRIVDRQAASYDRIIDDLVDFLPEAGQGTARSHVRATVDAAKPAIQEAYKSAYSVPVDAMPKTLAEIGRIRDTPMGQDAWAQAKKMAMNEHVKIAESPPDMRTIDYVQRALRDIESGETKLDMASGRPAVTNLGRQAKGMRDALLGHADVENPAFKEARRMVFDVKEFQRQVEMGKRIKRKDVVAADLAEDMAGMGPDEQLAYRIGAVRALMADVGEGGGPTINRAKALLGPSVRQKLEAIEATPGAAARLVQAMQAEATMAGTNQKLLNNSRTAQRLANLQEMEEGALSDLIVDGATGSAGGLVRRMVGGLARAWSEGRMAMMTQRTAGRVAQNLGATGEREIADMLERLQQMQAPRPLPRMGPASLGGGIASGGLLGD